MDSNVCKLRYVFRNYVESTWDALLINCMTKAMVASLAYAITKSTTKQAAEEEIIKRVLKDARAVDGQEVTPETIGDFPLLSNRMR
jgi:ferritin-like protein